MDEYNTRKEEDQFTIAVHEEAIAAIMKLVEEIKHESLGSSEEKAFFDILKKVTVKHGFEHDDGNLEKLASLVVAKIAEFTAFLDWSRNVSIRSKLNVALIRLLTANGH